MVGKDQQPDETCKRVRFLASTVATDFPEVPVATRFSTFKSRNAKTNLSESQHVPSGSSRATKPRVSKSDTSSFFQDSLPDFTAAWTSVTQLVGIQDSPTQPKRTKSRHRSSNVQICSSREERRESNIESNDAKQWLLPEHTIELRNADSRRCSSNAYRIDNRQLIARTQGLAYRRSKNLQDKAGDDEYVPWGRVVFGHDEGDGWLRVGECYLPMMLKNSKVIFQELKIASSSMGCSTDPQNDDVETGLQQQSLQSQQESNCSAVFDAVSSSSQSPSTRCETDMSCELRQTPKCSGLSDATSSTATGDSSEGAPSITSLEPEDVQEWLWPRKVRLSNKPLPLEPSSKSILVDVPRRSSRKDVLATCEDMTTEIPSSLHNARVHDSGSIAHAASAVNPDTSSLSNQAPSHTAPQPQTQIQPVQPQAQPHTLVPGIHVAPVPTYRMAIVELELDADNPYHLKVHEVEHVPRHFGGRTSLVMHSHDGPVVVHETPGHPVFHAYMLVKEPASMTPIPAPIADTNSTSLQYSSSPPYDPTASGLAPPPNDPPPTQPPPTHGAGQAAAHTAAMSSTAFAQFVEQGIIFGSISSVAMEMTQIAVSPRSSDQELGLFTHGPQLAIAAARGASIGALGAGLAFMFGPVAPTAILVGYGVSRECTDQALSWNRSEISGNDAAGRSLEVLLGATSGVTAAWGAAMLLAGMSGATVAAAAGVCGFAGNLGGRHLGKLIADVLVPMSDADRRLFLAYVELGVPPECTNKELERAFRKAALACHPDKAKNDNGKSHAKFARLSAAMHKIRAARGITARTHRNSTSTPLSLQAK